MMVSDDDGEDGGDMVIGTLRSNDTDVNENVIKTIGLMSKTTTLHAHHTFMDTSFPFLPTTTRKWLI